MDTIVKIIFATAMLPLLINVIAAYFRNKELGYIDNRNPRQHHRSKRCQLQHYRRCGRWELPL